MAALLAGERPAVVSRDLGVPGGTVRSWKHRLKNGTVATLKKGDFGKLLLEHLEASLRSLITQAERLADPGVLEGMRAGELAIFFGAHFDRTLRILELAPSIFGAPRGQQEGNKRAPGEYRYSTDRVPINLLRIGQIAGVPDGPIADGRVK
jgi:hypothetical protein